MLISLLLLSARLPSLPKKPLALSPTLQQKKVRRGIHGADQQSSERNFSPFFEPH